MMMKPNLGGQFAAARMTASIVGPCTALVLSLVLQGCASLHGSQRPTPDTAPTAPTAETPTEPPADDGNSAAKGMNGNAEADAGSTADAKPGDSSSAAPPCICMDAKLKPKPRPRPKPVHKEAPPQLATAPVVEETPPGGIVDAQVKPMSVSVMSILGKRVKGAHGEDLGRVVDVLADASGRVRIAIIDFGGFLGVGNHRIAVEWPLLRFNPDGADPSLLLSLSPEKLRTAPEYKDNPRPQTLMEPVAPPAAAAAPPSAEVKK